MIHHLARSPRRFRFPPRIARSLVALAKPPENDLLDISSFGDYNLVLPQDPHKVGVEHIQPLSVPTHIVRPPYVQYNGCYETTPSAGDSILKLGSPEELRMRRASALARATLKRAGELVKIGTTTSQIDSELHDFIIENSAYPSPLLYSGFPKSCCTSVNNIIAHGIPDDRPLEDGDIINIDVTVYLDGVHGDTSRTFLVGDVDQPGRDLVSATNEALRAGIDACGPGRPFKGIGEAISRVAAARGFSVNAELTGHGIGKYFHTPPWILHHRNDEPGVMQPGLCFTIEPLLVQGDDARGWMLPDGWTVLTETGARSAQAEHTILITDVGVDILTGEPTV